MDEDIKKFLEEDNIDKSKLLANSEIMGHETKEIYQATARLHSQKDISDNATESIGWMALFYNQPLGFPIWFMTAYPDVVKWFSGLKEEEVISIIGNPAENYTDNSDHIKITHLRKIVDFYKTHHKLECC